MSTEPHISIKGKHLLASLLGALASMLIPIVLVVFFVLGEIYYPPENPENDGHIRGFAVFLGFIPLMFFSNFIYYIFMSLKERITLKKASIVSLLIAFILGFSFSRAISEGMPIVHMISIGLSISAFIGISLCIGAWAWHKKLNT